MDRNDASSSRSLDRQIGFVGLMFTGITGTIGSGWLFASLYSAQMAGPAAVFSWLVGGLVTISLALVYAELGGMIPMAGAIAGIPHVSHGTINSFMAGWLCWVAYVATAPIEVTAVLDYSSNYVPWLTVIVNGQRELSNHGLAAATVLMLIFTTINVLGVKWLAHANIAITSWKLAVPLLAPIVLMAVGFRSENFYNSGGFAPNGVAGVLGAVSSGGVMFSLFGFRMAVDMAGETKNPQRTVPMAMVAAVIVCIVVYILLQVAFIGVIPPDRLKHGWHEISENIPGGPFAAFASVLGLQWLAIALYFDAIISPGGTGLAVTGATARINYAMAVNGQFPSIFKRLNSRRVPVWSLLFNFAVGMLVFLPFPGWSKLVSFISSTIILSFAFGPVSLAAFRYQLPNLHRPFRVPHGIAFSAVAFVFVGFIVYWTGWETNWKVFLALLVGLGFLALSRTTRRDARHPLHFKASLWMWPYFLGLGLISYFGSYGNGLGILSNGVDLAVIGVFSVTIFVLALRVRLSDREAQRLAEAATRD